MDKKNILIVDDEPDILQVLSCGLAALGFSVTSINNGQEAIDLAIKNQPDGRRIYGNFCARLRATTASAR